ncbi:MAG: hypothetical protein N2C14_17260 [Planctomycetales bacterium]
MRKRNLCDFKFLQAGKARCERCGFTAKTVQTDASRIRRICPAKSEPPDSAGASDKLPSTARVAVTYLKDTAAHAASGFASVSAEFRDRRLAICKTCEMSVVRKGTLRCRHPDCGCYLERKAWRKSSRCPLGKWPPPDDGA